jgi:ABC-type glycerol-3-phosphate transport system substrate-binding protein
MMHVADIRVCRPVSLLLLILPVFFAGCPTEKKETTKRPLEGVSLRLAVVDDPALAKAVARMQGEWNAQTGSTFQVTELTEKDLERADGLPADAAICPSCLVGVLAERNWLAAAPENVLHSAQWGEIFDLEKLREAAWGGSTVAVPFGSPLFCCYYRADLLEKLGRHPPHTWTEYQDLAKLLAKSAGPLAGEGQAAKSAGPLAGEGQAAKSPRPLAGEGQGVRASWCGAIEPLSPGWAGLTLLARAAPYAKHRSSYSTLFDAETMAPLVAGPPFVQALEELAAAAKLGPADPLQYDPAAARAAFWRGQCGMAITWPTKGREERGEGRGPAASPAGDFRAGFAELPGAKQVFNHAGKRWDQRSDDEDAQVPLLGVAGRMGVVGAKSPARDAAFQLLLWLSDSRMRPQISAAGSATTLFSRSDLKTPMAWVEKPMSASGAAQYGEMTLTAFRHEQWLDALRIPGRAEYLAALDAAVAAVIRGKKSPTDALKDAANQWEKITKRLGLDRQRAAYRHSLGLD